MSRKLRRGELLELRMSADILGMLDAAGALGKLPLIAERVAFWGRHFTVDRRAEQGLRRDKVCWHLPFARCAV